MRIIKPGREPKKEIEQTCERCGCVFVYGKEDVNCSQLEDNSWVYCPCCKQAIEVERWSGY